MTSSHPIRKLPSGFPAGVAVGAECTDEVLQLVMDYPHSRKVGIAGPIAVGKTRLNGNLSSILQKVHPEWKVVCSEEEVPGLLLKEYIADPKRWADHFQTHMWDRAIARESQYEAFCNGLKAATPAGFPPIVTQLFNERAPEENVVFAVANSRPQIGNMSAQYFDEWYRTCVNTYLSDKTKGMDLFVYLFAPTHILDQRRKERDRCGEDKYETPYMEVVLDTFFRWVMQMASQKKVLVLDWTKYQDTMHVLAEISKYLKNPDLLPTLTLVDAKTLCSSGDIVQGEAPNPKPFGKTIMDLVSVSFNTVTVSSETEAGETATCYVDTTEIEKRRQLQYRILKDLAAGKSNLTVAL
jgi:deoxyadenosine/deoxycytidine kinase